MLDWFKEHSTALQGAAAFVAVLGGVLAALWWVLKRRRVEATFSPSQTNALVEEKTRRLEMQISALRLALQGAATDEERNRMRAQLDEALRLRETAEDRVAEILAENLNLRQQLEQGPSGTGEQRFDAARRALQDADTRQAISLLTSLAEESSEAAARASFVLGEIAEGEVRWSDAAEHYARAARLAPDFDRLRKAREFAWRAGQYEQAAQFGRDLVALAREGEDQRQLSVALNGHGLTLRAQGKLSEAETLYREALEIDAATVGVRHPDYAAQLNNLALLLQAQDKLSEAEPLYREALEIGAAAIGTRHPGYATWLSNLALLLQAQGKLSEAEPLFREALEIGAATIGTRHPDYAIWLNNLAVLLFETDLLDEAEAMMARAHEIFSATLPPDHPHAAGTRRDLAAIRAAIAARDGNP